MEFWVPDLCGTTGWERQVGSLKGKTPKPREFSISKKGKTPELRNFSVFKV